MAKISLTDMGVQKLTAGTYFDARTPAFGIRVGKHRKTWIATKGKDRRVITLGHYPTVSLSDARMALAPPSSSMLVTRTWPFGIVKRHGVRLAIRTLKEPEVGVPRMRSWKADVRLGTDRGHVNFDAQSTHPSAP